MRSPGILSGTSYPMLSVLKWYGGPFDPNAVDRQAIEPGLTKLAWRRFIGQMAFAKSRGYPG